MKLIQLCNFVLLLSIIMLFIGCEEFLPPREQPPELFTATTNTVYDYYSPRIPQTYRNQIKYTFVVKYIYDETIVDTLDFGGKLTLTWMAPTMDGNQSTSKTVELNESFIKYTGGYNRSTGVITLTPNDSLVIEYNWNFITDDSTNLLEYFPSYFRNGQSGCKISPRQTIRASASIRLIKFRSNIIIQPFDFTQCFFTGDNGTPPCSDFIWDPCK
ncbi:MAG: hypothetical protein PHP42_05705 [Bacteroidota bacterium]|nr:hypothetical protein [Bacteroidota bacterium]